jgi:hypothetical protein
MTERPGGRKRGYSLVYSLHRRDTKERRYKVQTIETRGPGLVPLSSVPLNGGLGKRRENKVSYDQNLSCSFVFAVIVGPERNEEALMVRGLLLWRELEERRSGRNQGCHRPDNVGATIGHGAIARTQQMLAVYRHSKIVIEKVVAARDGIKTLLGIGFDLCR